MTTPETSPATAKPGMPPWAKKAIGIAVMAVVLVIAYFILAAFLPRWWAQRIASLANGSFSAGIAWGLAVRSRVHPGPAHLLPGGLAGCASASMLESCRSRLSRWV